MDKGPWRVYVPFGDVVGVISEDFKRDVALEVTGDFADDAERRAYCEWLAETLTDAHRLAGEAAELLMDAYAGNVDGSAALECAKALMHASRGEVERAMDAAMARSNGSGSQS